MRRLLILHQTRSKVALGIHPFLAHSNWFTDGSDIRKAENEQGQNLVGPSFC